MEKEPEINFKNLSKELNKLNVRYLLIGRQALILYGAPLLSFDYDLWINPMDKRKSLEYLITIKGFEASHDINDPFPIFTVFAGDEKLDLFFFRSIKNIEGEEVYFQTAYKNATIISDQGDKDFLVRIPCIDDLIKLKKIRPPNVKDEEDIKYLLLIKSKERKF